jgi:LuxR family maltose regulon positive regulatory protein
VAPAGYGKTTLLRQLVARDPRPSAWLTLDGTEAPSALVTELAAALDPILDPQPVPAGTPGGPQVPPGSSEPGPSHSVLTRLLAGLDGVAQPVLLAVDAAEVVSDQGRREILSAVVDHLPNGSQLLLAGREGGWWRTARLRAEGRIVEVGPPDLAFTDAEAAEMARAMGLPVAEVVTLNQRIEGWPVMLTLGALGAFSATDGTRPEGSQAGDRFLHEYVRSEILSAPDLDLDFLSRVSLAEPISGALCDELLDVQGSGAVLARLAAATMLLLPVDDGREEYRLHPVIRDVLAAELRRRDPSAMNDVRRRAGRWYRTHGRPEQAMAQAIALGDPELVVELAGEYAQRLYQKGRVAVVEQWFRWIDDHDATAGHPEVAILGAWIHTLGGRAAGAERLLATAERELRAVPEAGPLKGTALAVRAAMCRRGARGMRSDATAAVTLLDPGHRSRAAALGLLGVAHFLLGDDDQAAVTLTESVEAAEDTGATPTASVVLATLSLLAACRHDPVLARTLAERACRVVADGDLDDATTSGVVFATAAHRRLADGEVAAGRALLGRAQRLRPGLTHAFPFCAVITRIELARCYVLLTDVAGARTVLREASEILQRRPDLGRLADDLTHLSRQVDTLQRGMVGASSLTSAELRLLPLLSTHLSFREIGRKLFISPNTVKTEAISIYRKLSASSRGEAIAKAQELGLLGDPGAQAPVFIPRG